MTTLGDKDKKYKSRIPDALKQELERLGGKDSSPEPPSKGDLNKDASTMEIKPFGKAKSENGIDRDVETKTEDYSGVKVDVVKAPETAVPEKVKEVIERRKTLPRITLPTSPPDVKSGQAPEGQNKLPADLETLKYPTLADNTYVKDRLIPNLPGTSGLIETTGEIMTTAGNTFNQWLNSMYQNAVNPNKQGIPMNPIMDIPFSEELTKYIPGYVNPRHTSTENLPEGLKNLQLKDDSQFKDVPPTGPVEFVGHLLGGLAPIALSSMMGLPPSVGFPLISEPEIQQQLKNGKISQGDANWERAAQTFMGGMFELPVAKNLMRDLADIDMKESVKLGLSKAGDVLFKTIGTGMIDATKQMVQGKVPDFKEVALNAGTIFVMELFGGHKKLKKMVEKYGEENMLKFAEDVALNNEPMTDWKRLLPPRREQRFEVDPQGNVIPVTGIPSKIYEQIKTEVEAVHNRPITDVRRLLLGKREQRFEIDPEGKVTEIKPTESQQMLLSSIEKLYGMKEGEIKASQEKLTTKGTKITEKSEEELKPDKQPWQQEQETAKKLLSEKQAWEIPKQQYVDALRNVETPSGRKTFDKNNFAKDWEESHREEVVKAINEKKAIPEDVINDYPELKVFNRKETKTEGKTPTPASQVLPLGKGETKSTEGWTPVEKKDLKVNDVIRSKQMPNVNLKVADLQAKYPNMITVLVPSGEKSLIGVKGMEKKVRSVSSESSAEFTDRPERYDATTKMKLDKLRELEEKIKNKIGGSREGAKLPKEEISKLNKRLENTQKSIEKITSRDDKYYEARKRIQERKGKYGLRSQIAPNPENLPDYVTIGKQHFKEIYSASKDKTVRFTEWAIKMVDELGEYIKPYLKKIWGEVSKAEVKSEKAKTDEFKTERRMPTEEEKKGFFKQGFDDDLERRKYETSKSSPDAKASPPSKGDYESPSAPAKDGTVPLRTKESVTELKQRFYNIRKERDKVPESSQEFKDMTTSMDILKNKIQTMQTASTKDFREQEPKGRKELMNFVIKKLPDYESEVNSAGYTGNDAIEQVKQLIKRDLYKSKSWQELEPNEKTFVIKSLNEHYNTLYRERLGLPFALDEPYVERLNKVAYKTVVKQSLNVVKKMGEAGKEFANRMNNMAERERELMGEPSVFVLDAAKLTKEEYANLTKIRNAMRDDVERKGLPLPTPMNEKVKAVNEQLSEIYGKFAELADKNGFETLNPATGERKMFTPRKNYEPKVLELNLDKLGVVRDNNGVPIKNVKRERQLEYMVETNQANNKAEASYKLDEYLGAKTSIGKAGNLEFSRIDEINFAPEMYVQDPVQRLIKYATKVSHRIAHAEQFGMEGDIATRLLGQLRGEHYDDVFVKNLYDYETGNLTQKERNALRFVNTAKGLMTVTKFTPFTTLRNSLQGFLGSSLRGNIKSALIGLVKSYTYMAKRNAYESGALADSIQSVVMKEFGGDKTYVGTFLKMIGFTANDRFNRVISATAGESFYKDMLKRIKNDSILKKRALREFEKIGLNADEVVKRGEFTENELNLIRRTFAGDTQFNIRPSDLPLWWSSPTGKLVTQWKPFGYKMTQLIGKSVFTELKHGNIAPLITLLAAYGAGGEAVNMIIDQVRSLLGYNPRKDSKDTETAWEKSLISKVMKGDGWGFLKRYTDDMAGVGALSLLWDIYRSVGYGKSPTGDITQGVSSVLVGPTVSTVVRVASDIFGPVVTQQDDMFVKSLRNIYRTVVTNFVPYGGIPRTLGFTKALEDVVFGENVKEKEKDYRELKDRGVDISKLKEIDAKQKKVGELHDMALKTKDKSDIDAYVKADEELDRLRDESAEYGEYLKLQREQKKTTEEIFGKENAKTKIYKQIQDRGGDIKKLEEIDGQAGIVSKLREKALERKNPEDIKKFKEEQKKLEQMRGRTREYRLYLDLRERMSDEEKKVLR